MYAMEYMYSIECLHMMFSSIFGTVEFGSKSAVIGVDITIE